jgi:hypothetical protein
MFASTTLALQLALQTPPPEGPAPKAFAPVRAEITTDEYGIEILVYDERDELVGALVATPEDEYIAIDADFDDGYASIALTLGPIEEPEKNLQSNLDPAVVADRVSEMFAFVAPPELSPFAAPSKQECMWILAGVAGTCGLGALFPPASVYLVWACLSGAGGALCACGDYLPIDICP